MANEIKWHYKYIWALIGLALVIGLFIGVLITKNLAGDYSNLAGKAAQKTVDSGAGTQPERSAGSWDRFWCWVFNSDDPLGENECVDYWS